jgi:hypothetical protein
LNLEYLAGIFLRSLRDDKKDSAGNAEFMGQLAMVFRGVNNVGFVLSAAEVSFYRSYHMRGIGRRSGLSAGFAKVTACVNWKLKAVIVTAPYGAS